MLSLLADSASISSSLTVFAFTSVTWLESPGSAGAISSTSSGFSSEITTGAESSLPFQLASTFQSDSSSAYLLVDWLLHPGSSRRSLQGGQPQ
ncbi:hypothetical protein N7493_011008 [Penicillium malachiteum]|uniref:Uncharacterized protein n=1 Tax=Penicillium malachiteum TaxID=1324776 RepID=A0AAD6HBB7_9EURO|nr:hypothetical protein N7493_011008 [Penicillium malachiteum]